MKTIIFICLALLVSTQAQALEYSVVNTEQITSVPNEHMLSKNILRGGRPTQDDLIALKKLGYKTIINLENDINAVEAEKTMAANLGFKYVVSSMNAFSVPNEQQMNDIQNLLKDSKNHPIFIHCLHGRDRTGLVAGLYRVFVDKWKQDAAYKEMLDLGFRPFFTGMKDYFFEKTKGQ